MSNEKNCCNCLYTNHDLRGTHLYWQPSMFPDCQDYSYGTQIATNDCAALEEPEEAPTPNMQEPKVEPELRNAHYQTDIQPIEFMQANMSPEAFKGGLLFNIFKYSSRFGKKDDELKEAIKIADYSRWLVLAVQGKKIDPRKD